MKHPYFACLIVVLLFFTISAFLYAVQFKKLTSARVILETFDKSNVYNELPKMVDQAFKSPKSKVEEAIIFKAVSLAIEPKYLRTQVETNLPPFVDYLNSKTDTLNVNVDLRPFKNNFSMTVPQNLAKVVADSIGELPKCDQPQNVKTGELPQCQEGSTAEISKQAQEIAGTFNYKDFLGGVPDTFKFSDSNSSDQTFNSARKTFKVLNIVFIFSAALSLVFLLILFLIGLSNIISALRWTGLALVIPSGVHLIITLVGKASINPILSACVSKTNPTLGNILKPVVDVFATNFFFVTILYGGIIFFIGLVMIILSFIFSSTKPKKQNVQPTPQLPK